MKTSLLTAVALLLAGLPVHSQVPLKAGESFSYSFTNLPQTVPGPGFGDLPVAGFTFRLSEFEAGVDVLHFEMFEGAVTETPIFEAVAEAVTDSGSVVGAWGDFQGTVRFTMVSGTATLDRLSFFHQVPLTPDSWQRQQLSVVPVRLRGDGPSLFYTNESAFRSALATLGLAWFTEGFEGPEWQASRYPGTNDNVFSQGVGWYAEERLATLLGGWARTGNYGVFNTVGTGDGDPAPDDALYPFARDLAAIGGWFAGSGTLRVYDGRGRAGSIELLRANQTTNSPYQFAGVINPAGLGNVEFGGGQFGADDFTIALARPPVTAPQVRVTQLSPRYGTQLVLEGQRGRTNVIEVSADLLSWTPFFTNVMPYTFCPTCPFLNFSDAAGTNLSHRYYRAFAVP